MELSNRQVLEAQMILQQLSNVRVSSIALWVIPNERILGILTEDARKALRAVAPPAWTQFEQERSQQREISHEQLGILRQKYGITDDLLKEVEQHWQIILAASVNVVGIKPLPIQTFYAAIEMHATDISAQEIRFLLALGLLREQDEHGEEVVSKP